MNFIKKLIKIRIIIFFYLLKRPNSSTPKAANMKKSRKNNKDKFPIWGKAWRTVSMRDRIPVAILTSLRTLIIIRK